MKNLRPLIVIALVFSIFMACGHDDPPVIPPVEPPVIQNTVGFSCLDVGHGSCAGEFIGNGIWNSVPVTVKGNPAPASYLNVEVTNDMETSVPVFVYSPLTIKGCWDEPVAFAVANISSGETAIFQHVANNYRCGALGPQETEIMLYNASGFDPAAYPNPLNYPRTDMICNAVVRWENALY